MDNYVYDVALSFASEQRNYVEKVAEHLKILGINVFYDDYQKNHLWGKNLIKYLEKVYYHDSRYCVIFISKEYKDKYWTQLECETIEERIFSEKDDINFQECILPVRFDTTKIPGIKNTLGVIYAQETTPQKLAQMIYEKVQNSKSFSTETIHSINLDDIFEELIKKFPSSFIKSNLKKSIVNQSVDAILFFDMNNSMKNNFSCYDGKLFFDEDGKLFFLNLGYFNKTEILFEITVQKLIDLITKKML